MIKRIYLGLALALGTALCTGCTSDGDEDLKDDDLKLDVDWHDILESRNVDFEPNKAHELEEIVLTPERLAALPHTVRQHPDLARYAVTRFLRDPAPYEGGVLGKVGHAKVFVAPTAQIKDDARLYWVMVKTLSEKYGCFMTAKQNLGKKTRIWCRDKRQVMFWTSRGPDWIQFFARQYDAQGYEIKVQQKRIVRVGTDKVL